MSTIDSKNIIITMLKNNGIFPGDPQCYTITSYVNTNNIIAFSVAYNEAGLIEAFLSSYVNNPKILWHSHVGLSSTGKAWLLDQNDDILRR